MEPYLIKVNIPGKESFSMNRYCYAERFPGIWHFHNEYELTLILRSVGTRLVGDHIERFEEGDLIFIGTNLPHTWRTEEVDVSRPPEALVIHFTPDFLGDPFLQLPEMGPVRQLFGNAKRGIRITGKTRESMITALLDMEKARGLEKLIGLISLLNDLSGSSDLTLLASEGFTNSINQFDSERLNRVYEYIMNHFQDDISLVQVASVANMSPTAFSRYFKNRTRKSFSEFLSGLKIGYACKLLMKEEMTVTQVCYESGFQNLSNFNQQFKSVTKLTPKQYQLLYTRR
jgi:AraC-like DNA-binding protein